MSQYPSAPVPGGLLTGPEIERLVRDTAARKARGDFDPFQHYGIEIDPFDPGMVGPNSVDVTLGDTLKVYEGGPHDAWHSEEHTYENGVIVRETGVRTSALVDFDRLRVLQVTSPNPTRELTIPPEGLVIVPGELYLGSIAEKVAGYGYVPWLDGRSSIGRLGVAIHVTAGRGDDGFSGVWTVEIWCVRPVRLKPGMRIGQFTFFTTKGERKPYQGRYQTSRGPTASRYHK